MRMPKSKILLDVNFYHIFHLEEKQKIIGDIRDLSKKKIAFPFGINNVFFNNDKDNQLNSIIFRTTNLPLIIKLFKIISYIACTFK